jgi:hypothetical protein
MNVLFLTLKITFLLFKSIKCLSHLGWINCLLLNFVKTNVMKKLICINYGKNIYWLLCVHYYQMSLWTGNVVRMSTLKRNESYMDCYGFQLIHIIFFITFVFTKLRSKQLIQPKWDKHFIDLKSRNVIFKVKKRRFINSFVILYS